MHVFIKFFVGNLGDKISKALTLIMWARYEQLKILSSTVTKTTNRMMFSLASPEIERVEVRF
jgi:hypothetical protein